MKTKFPPVAISLLTAILVPLVPIIGLALRWLGYPQDGTGVFIRQILIHLFPIFIFAGLPSLLLSAIANYFLKKFGASERSILLASIAIGVVIGSIAFLPVLMAGGQ